MNSKFFLKEVFRLEIIFLLGVNHFNRPIQLCSFCAVGLEPPQLSVSEERNLAILTELPFVVPFEERVKVQPAVTNTPATDEFHLLCVH